MFKRSTLVGLASTSLLAGVMLFTGAAHALTIKPFTDANFAAAQATGKPVAMPGEFLEFCRQYKAQFCVPE